MAIKRNAAGVPTDITVLKRRIGGVWVDAFAQSRAFRKTGGVWVDLLPLAGGGLFSVSVDSASSSVLFTCTEGFPPPIPRLCPSLKTLTVPTRTASAVGGSGVGPTYLWEYVSGDLGFTATAPTAAATAWTINLPQNSYKQAIWKCTATRGVNSQSVEVSVIAEYDMGGIEP